MVHLLSCKSFLAYDSVKVQAQSSGVTNQEVDMPNVKIKSDTIDVLLLFLFLTVQKKKVSSLLF